MAGTSTNPTTDDLLPRVAAGDAGAVRACIDRYAGLILALARRLSITGADADDAMQEIFVELWKSASRFDPAIAPEAAFVAMIARRRLIDRRRRLDRQDDRASLSEATAGAAAVDSWRGPLGSDAEGPSRAASREESGRAAQALDQLTPEQQRVLRLSIQAGMSHETISNALNMPLGTVKTHARRGLMRLRQLLGLEGADASMAKGGVA